MKKNYDLILISTCCDHKYIFKLIESVLYNNNTVSVCMIIVNQTKESIKKIASTDHSDTIVIEHGKNVNTSVARNIASKYVFENNYFSNFVCFPDDHSSYDQFFF